MGIFSAKRLGVFVSFGLLVACSFVLVAALAPGGAVPSQQVQQPYGALISGPNSVSIAGATVDTTPSPSTGSWSAHVYWSFGTVVGSYGTCTVQAKTTYDGTNYLTLGAAASVTVSSDTAYTWDIYQQAAASTGVTTSTPSTSAALGFGQLTKLTFACSGGYGTTAPSTVTVIYR